MVSDLRADPIAVLAPSQVPFVGRTKELDVVRACLEKAKGGEPQVVLISGDAGMGKSRLAREAVVIAEALEMQVCSGRFIEDGTAPYLPWTRSLLPQLERAALLTEEALGREAAVLQHLLEPVPTLAEDGLRRNLEGVLFSALAEAAMVLSARRPLLFVVDDLQWAETNSLEAFLHLVLALADAGRHRRPPICVLALTRPPATAPDLARITARCRRESFVRWLELEGLADVEMNELLRQSVASPCEQQLVGLLQEATGGNPLFVGEAMSYLAANSGLSRRDGYILVNLDLRELPLPAEIGSAIASRAGALSPECARLLSMAALIGDEFSPQLLGMIAERDADLVLNLLDEAFEARFVVDSDQGFRFAHPVVRRVFALRGTAVRRQRTHLWIAEHMERLGPEAGGTTLAVASHYLAAGRAADPLVAGLWAVRAGDEALAMYAWGEAARYYDAALAIPAFRDSLTPAERASALYRAGLGHLRTLDVPRARERLAEAVQSFKEVGDLEGWGIALADSLRAIAGHGNVAIGRPPDASEFAAYIEAVGESRPRSLGRVLEQWAELLYIARDPRAGEYAAAALEVAKASDDHALGALANSALGLAAGSALRLHEALAHFDAATADAARVEDPWYRSWSRQNAPQFLLCLGRLDEAEALTGDVLAAASLSKNWSTYAQESIILTQIASTRGDFEAAERYAADAQGYLNLSDYSIAPLPLYFTVARNRLIRGDWQGAADVVELLHRAGGTRASWTVRQLVAAASGNVAGAAAELQAHPAWGFWQAPVDIFTLPLISLRLELADALPYPPLAEFPVEALQQAVGRGMAFDASNCNLLRRQLGVAEFLLGHGDAAETHLQRAIEEGHAIGARPEVARAWYDLARVLLGRGEGRDHARAAEALNASLALFEEMGMTPFSERARALGAAHGIELPKPTSHDASQLGETDLEVLLGIAGGESDQALADRLLLAPATIERRRAAIAGSTGVTDATSASAYLEAAGLAFDTERSERVQLLERPGARGGLRVLMFSDIVDSTPLNTALGDETYYELLRKHDEIIRRAVREHSGRVVKHMGDGMFATFRSAESALAVAIELRDRFPISLPGREDLPLQIRIGLHAGEPVATDTDLFGIAVTMAKRICDRAGDGRVLVSEPVRQLAAGGRFQFSARGRYALKGLAERYQLYDVALAGP
jgi:class 3 adenylate cyclase/tetratricopeptide (TPR) repeat protein